MKYRLIDKTTGIETLCDKVTIDGFDYYVSDEKINSSNYENFNFWFYNPYIKALQIDCNPDSCHKVIATNNPNIDIPKVVDEVERLAWKHIKKVKSNAGFNDFISGYNKSKETHSFSEEDMVDFAEFYFREEFNATMQDCKSSKEILRLWKKQQPKIVYYG